MDHHFINPKLIKDIRKGNYRTISSSENFALQQNLNWKPEKSANPAYRIVTRPFPRYRVVANDDLEFVQNVWSYLHHTIGFSKKYSSQKLVKIIKLNARSDGILNQLSEDEGESSTASDSDEEIDELKVKIDQGNSFSVNESPTNQMDELLNAASDNNHLDNSDTEVPLQAPVESSVDSQIHAGTDVNNWLSQVNEATGILSALEATKDSKWKFDEFKEKYYDALFMPDSNSKMSKFELIRERHLVRRRQFALFMVTIYAIIIRYCSFDFFLVLLFLSNFGMIYVLRNSRKINIQMAKKSVKNRVGWAKQYLGEWINKKNNTSTYIGEIADKEDDESPQSVPSTVQKIRLIDRIRKKSSNLNESTSAKSGASPLTHSISTGSKLEKAQSEHIVLAPDPIQPSPKKGFVLKKSSTSTFVSQKDKSPLKESPSSLSPNNTTSAEIPISDKP